MYIYRVDTSLHISSPSAKLLNSLLFLFLELFLRKTNPPSPPNFCVRESKTYKTPKLDGLGATPFPVIRWDRFTRIIHVSYMARASMSFR